MCTNDEPARRNEHFYPLFFQSCSPLHNVASNGQTDCARLLLAHGADPNLEDGDGDTPADTARNEGETEMAEYIDSWKGDVDPEESPAQQLALMIKMDKADQVKVLLNGGLDVKMSLEKVITDKKIFSCIFPLYHTVQLRCETIDQSYFILTAYELTNFFSSPMSAPSPRKRGPRPLGRARTSWPLCSTAENAFKCFQIRSFRGKKFEMTRVQSRGCSLKTDSCFGRHLLLIDF